MGDSTAVLVFVAFLFFFIRGGHYGSHILFAFCIIFFSSRFPMYVCPLWTVLRSSEMGLDKGIRGE